MTYDHVNPKQAKCLTNFSFCDGRGVNMLNDAPSNLPIQLRLTFLSQYLKSLKSNHPVELSWFEGIWTM